MSARTIEIAAARLYQKAGAARWALAIELFTEALETSAKKNFATRTPEPRELDRYFDSLHLEDLALACACATGQEAAWEHFVREYRPVLYRSADAIDTTGGARELADLLYGELFGVSDQGRQKTSLFRYFHGRSSLATWLRAVLAQRHVDRLRRGRRLEPVPDDESLAIESTATHSNPDRQRYLALIQTALALALGRIDSRDRLRVGCYYSQEMTLAQIGKVLGEHEATVSRHLTRTRRALRVEIENHLLDEARLSRTEIAECFETVMDDAGSIDLKAILARNPEGDRSK